MQKIKVEDFPRLLFFATKGDSKGNGVPLASCKMYHILPACKECTAVYPLTAEPI